MELMEGWGERLTASCSSTTAPLAPRFLPELRSVTSSRGSRASALRAFGPPAERALLESRRLTYLPPFIVSWLLVASDTHRACAEAQTPSPLRSVLRHHGNRSLQHRDRTLDSLGSARGTSPSVRRTQEKI